MRLDLKEKIRIKLLPLVWKITGHYYTCCDGYKRCSRCKHYRSVH